MTPAQATSQRIEADPSRTIGRVRVLLSWLLLPWCVWLCALPAPSEAAGISADLHTESPIARGEDGTAALFVYSERFTIDGQPAPAGPNARSTLSEVAIPFLAIPDILLRPVPAAQGVVIRVGDELYGPVVGVNMRPKTFRFGVEGEAARSESPERDRRAVSVARHQSGGLVTVFSETRGDNVVGLPDSGIGGKAASAAFDPFDVSSGEYLYAPTISAAFQMDEIGDFGGIVFFALDSRLSSRAAVDLFYERGQPFSEALWAMSITTRGRLVSDSDNDLNVRFSINPIARSPGSAGQRPILDPSVSDEDIGAAIKSRFHVADGTAILEESPFFPTGTMYRVDANGVDGPTRFGFGVNAGLTTAVPGPSALALLLIGGLTLRAVVACRSSAANAVDGGMGEALLRPRLSPPFRRRPDL